MLPGNPSAVVDSRLFDVVRGYSHALENVLQLEYKTTLKTFDRYQYVR